MNQDDKPPPSAGAEPAWSGILDRLRGDGDYVVLEPTSYEAYATVLARLSSLLLKLHGDPAAQAKAPDLAPTRALVQLLANSFSRVLARSRYGSSSGLILDLKDGGLPNFLAMVDVEADLANRERQLAQLDPEPMLREQVIHALLDERRYPTELVYAIGIRRYYESLDETQLFSSRFIAGELRRLDSSREDRELFEFAWGHYAPDVNLPVLHRLVFEWSGKKSFTEDAMPFRLLKNVIRAESSHMPSVIARAAMIDERLPHVHPKRLTEIRLGPVRLGAFSREQENVFVEALRRVGDPEDFVLEVHVSEAFSNGEFAQAAGFFEGLISPPKPKQQFLLPGPGKPGGADGASSCDYSRLLVPHHVWQAIPRNHPQLEQFRNEWIVTYDRDGGLHVI